MKVEKQLSKRLQVTEVEKEQKTVANVYFVRRLWLKSSWLSPTILVILAVLSSIQF